MVTREAMSTLLARLVAAASSPVPPIADVEDLWKRLAPLGAEPPFARAVLGGAAADRPAYAFAAGYQAALHALLPGLEAGDRLCLAATEETGAHPARIATTVTFDGERGVLVGKKRWATLAPAADAILVLAKAGTRSDGKADLVLVRVPRDAVGLTIAKMPETPFAPEIPHAELTLEGVEVRRADVLPGDAWVAYVRPFRTVEDTHVIAAVAAWVFAVGLRAGAADERLAELAATIGALATIAASDPSAPATHIALAGAIAQVRRGLDPADAWARVPAETRAFWERDRPLLQVADRARAARAEAAWKAAGAGMPRP